MVYKARLLTTAVYQGSSHELRLVQGHRFGAYSEDQTYYGNNSL